MPSFVPHLGPSLCFMRIDYDNSSKSRFSIDAEPCNTSDRPLSSQFPYFRFDVIMSEHLRSFPLVTNTSIHFEILLVPFQKFLGLVQRAPMTSSGGDLFRLSLVMSSFAEPL